MDIYDTGIATLLALKFLNKILGGKDSNYNNYTSTDRGSAECWTAARRTRANLIRAGSGGGELKQTSQKGEP